MAKAYTDLEQSKKLAEILPVESADMKWFVPADNESEFIEEVSLINNKSEYNLFDKVTDWNDTPYVPCWSLAALLNILRSRPDSIPSLSGGGYKDGNYIPDWCLDYEYDIGDYQKTFADNPVDACYEMILKLHEQKLL